LFLLYEVGNVRRATRRNHLRLAFMSTRKRPTSASHNTTPAGTSGVAVGGEELIEVPPQDALNSMAVELIGVDFTKVYDVYLFQLRERVDALKHYVLLITGPFILLSAAGLVALEKLQPATLSATIKQIPPIFFAVFILTGFIGILPFHRFVAAHAQAYKMMRYMNNFRRLYYAYFRDEFTALHWIPVAEDDPNYPQPRLGFHWVTGVIVLIALLNTTYVTLGIYWMEPTSYHTGEILGAGLSIAIHWLLWKDECKTPDVNRLRGVLTDPQGGE
jgi:hypothetical protein